MNCSKTALILLEFQNDFITPGGKLYPLVCPSLIKNNVVENVGKIIDAARSNGILIIHAPIQFSSDYSEMGNETYGILKAVKDSGALVRGSWGAGLAPVIAVAENDIIITGKSTIDAFSGTSLDLILRSHGIDSIAIAGQLTNICVESTMRSAYDKGYKVMGISDACSTISIEQHENAVKFDWPMFSRVFTHHEFIDHILQK